MSYIIYGAAILVVLHIYYRLAFHNVYADKLSEKLEDLHEVVARIVWDADDTAHFPGNIVFRHNLNHDVAVRLNQPTSNDNGGEA